MKPKHLLIVLFITVFNNLISQNEINLTDTIDFNKIFIPDSRTFYCYPEMFFIKDDNQIQREHTLTFDKEQSPNHLAFNYQINSNDSITCQLRIYNKDSQTILEKSFTLLSTQGNVERFEMDLDKIDYKGDVTIELQSKLINHSNSNVTEAIFDVEFSKTLSMDIEPFNLFDFYPNPSMGTFNVLIKDGIQIKNIEVFEMNGRNLKDIDVNGTFVNLGSVYEGVFIIVVSTDVGPFTKKLVVRR